MKNNQGFNLSAVWFLIIANLILFIATYISNDLYYDVQCENVHTEDEIFVYGNVKYIIPYPEYIWMAYYWGKNVGKYY